MIPSSKCFFKIVSASVSNAFNVSFFGYPFITTGSNISAFRLETSTSSLEYISLYHVHLRLEIMCAWGDVEGIVKEMTINYTKILVADDLLY